MENFFECLYHDKPPGYILVWSKGDRMVSTWHNTIEGAILQSQQDKENNDVYVGCGISSSLRKSNERCPANEIMGIPGVWIDIDFATNDENIHKKTNLPETPEKAMEILDTFPIKPTILINSGHGFQAWWIFEKFLIFKGDHTRNDGALLVQTFNWSLRDMARSMGYDIDSTQDLARVMRVPGTINHKDKKNEVPVQIVKRDKKYIPYQDFVDAVIDYRKQYPKMMITRPSQPASTAINVDDFVLDPSAMPTQHKFDTMMDMDPKFRATWEYKRKDLGDTSPSSYDLSLASMAFAMDWSKQEVVDLLVACRRNHHVEIKRPDYYRRTLAKAYSVIENRKDMEAIAALNVELEHPYPEDRHNLVNQSLEIVSRILGITITEINRYITEPAEFQLVTNKGAILLGEVSFLTNQGKLGDKVAAITLQAIPLFKNDRWVIIKQNLLNCVTDKYVGEEATNKGRVRSWLRSYLEYNDPLYDKNEAVEFSRPYFANQSLYLFLANFKKFLGVHHKENITAISLGILLREYGAESHGENFKRDAKKSNRSVFEIPIKADPRMITSFLRSDQLDLANELQRDEEAQPYPRLVENQ